MINVKVTYQKDLISKVVISGHAEYDESGKDIVCAAVSAIAITTENAIHRLYGDVLKTSVKDGYLQLEVTTDDLNVQILLNNMLDLLKQLENQYPKYIKI